MKRGYLQKINKNIWVGALLCGVMGLTGCIPIIDSPCEPEKESPRLVCQQERESDGITIKESSINLSKPAFSLKFHFPAVPTQTQANKEDTLKGITFHFEQEFTAGETKQSSVFSLLGFKGVDQGSDQFEYTIPLTQDALNKFVSGKAFLVVKVKDKQGESTTRLDINLVN